MRALQRDAAGLAAKTVIPNVWRISYDRVNPWEIHWGHREEIGTVDTW